jgi:cob(I)alamin adenosyltransferase
MAGTLGVRKEAGLAWLAGRAIAQELGVSGRTPFAGVRGEGRAVAIAPDWPPKPEQETMVRLNAIYTRTGDKGETGLGDGSRRPKFDPRVAAIGDVDETNSAIGLARLAVGDSTHAALIAIEPMLERIQNDLFDLGADLCLPARGGEKPGDVLRVSLSQVEALERAIDGLNDRLHPLRSFVLPGGTATSASLHQARAVCRRAERSVAALAATEGEEVGETALAYINRLSDYLFVAARAANDFGMADVLWTPGAHQTESR